MTAKYVSIDLLIIITSNKFNFYQDMHAIDYNILDKILRPRLILDDFSYLIFCKLLVTSAYNTYSI